ncbi:hyp37.3 putative secreted salivary gland protein [Culex quinquefasciatus]|uniref:Hyp37.3 putative secreted salivary gland protein n=1 Tax=Culex quinquefasciatus TaxID=7176 RepID=B0WYG8_CULQU|nr:hyp37.3 putative secreted salivary gland protein [Culex quinquefasciatus]|eukprot:XP_001862440.1 hyp37.3 putative secreted salivary gland protein [Culex quinquefasciatus]
MVAWAASSSNPSIRGELQSLNAGMLKTDSESIVKKLAQTLATGPGKNKTSKGKSNEKATGEQSKGTKSEKKTQGSGTGDQPNKEGRKKSECAPDESSDTSDMYTIRSLSYHFKKRMTRIVRLAAMGQFVSEQTSVFRQELLIGGRSQFHDRSSHISGYHAAHVVRESLTSQVQDILERMKAAFLTVFLNAIFSEELNEEQLNDLTDVVETLQEISIYDMFMKGKTWYEGKYLELNYCSDSDTDSE